MSGPGILQVTSELMASVPRPVNLSSTLQPATQVRVERGLRFSVGDAFYRSESGAGRDLSVLAAIAYKRQHGELRAMDAMCGCGVRAMRYLVQAGADYVWANDACEQLRSCIVDNLQSVAPRLEVDEQGDSSGKWRVTSEDANKLLLGCYIREEYFDLIDVDSHGGNSVFLGSALAALKYGGLVYVTSTDGFSCSKRPYNALASYGAFTRRLPFTNEIGLRMLIGGVVREGATRNMRVLPLFSHYASHGPVFRIMLRMERGKLELSKNYGFIAHCEQCGSWQSVSWDDIGQTSPCCDSMKLKYTGPIWTGPLHSKTEVEKLVQLAKELKWIAPPGSHKSKLTSETARLTEVLDVMLEESDPAIPCGYLGLQEIASRGKVQTPRREDLTRYLRKEGYAVSRSQIEPNAIKTNASVAECIDAARRMFDI